MLVKRAALQLGRHAYRMLVDACEDVRWIKASTSIPRSIRQAFRDASNSREAFDHSEKHRTAQRMISIRLKESKNDLSLIEIPKNDFYKTQGVKK